MTLSLDQAINNEVSLKVPWEEDLQPGPVGEYVEVVDYDPGSECFLCPGGPECAVGRGAKRSGPAEGDPQFHQQMAYALVMSTIRHFERGLGRTVLWSPRIVAQEGKKPREEFVRRLRVYPHALRSPQAYYSPSKKGAAARLLPGRNVFSRRRAGPRNLLHLPVARHCGA